MRVASIAMTMLSAVSFVNATKSTDIEYFDHENASSDFELLEIYRREDPTFIEGLGWDAERGMLLESSGWNGTSKINWESVNDEDLSIDVEQSMSRPGIFGEGVSPINDHELIWMTYHDGDVFVVDKDTLEVKEDKTFDLWETSNEGWGLTMDWDNNILYMSDGTSYIHRINPETLLVESSFQVTENGSPVRSINELEFVKGMIWSNIFCKKDIIKIDPSNGHVVKRIDMSSLHDAEMRLVQERGEMLGYDKGNNVLNGIAYDAEKDEFYLTGKRWHMMFKLRILD